MNENFSADQLKWTAHLNFGHVWIRWRIQAEKTLAKLYRMLPPHRLVEIVARRKREERMNNKLTNCVGCIWRGSGFDLGMSSQSTANWNVRRTGLYTSILHEMELFEVFSGVQK